MALSGNIKDFDLTDIFQLIARQRKSGKLMLEDGADWAMTVFFNGDVLYSISCRESVMHMLGNYLVAYKRCSIAEADRLVEYYQDDLQRFIAELTEKKYAMAQEIARVVQLGIEDITCSLFLWHKGNYHFEALDDMSSFSILGITFPAEGLTMEAMRRMDQWQVMSGVMHEENVFLPTPALIVDDGVRANPASFVLYFLDGQRSITGLQEIAYFGVYRIYEFLYELWQSNRISIVETPQAAEVRQPQIKKHSGLGAILITIAITGFCCVLIVVAGVVLGTARLPAEFTIGRPSWQKSVELKVAALLYRAEQHRKPSRLHQFVEHVPLRPAGSAPLDDGR